MHHLRETIVAVEKATGDIGMGTYCFRVFEKRVGILTAA